MKKDAEDNIVATLSTKEFVEKYNSKNGRVKGGSLCFYGHWFGKPFDNVHTLIEVTFDSTKDVLTLTFGEKEVLTIWHPSDIKELSDKLTIQYADKILWQWYYYGRPQIFENQFFIEINHQDKSLTGQTNTNWYNEKFKDLDPKSLLFFGRKKLVLTAASRRPDKRPAKRTPSRGTLCGIAETNNSGDYYTKINLRFL